MLSEKTYELLKTYCSPRSPDADEGVRFEQLRKQKMIKICNFKSVDFGSLGTSSVPNKYVITELGKDALTEFEEYQDTMGKQLEAFQNIAVSAVRSADLAESEACSAKKDAKFSKVLSLLSIVLGFGSLIVAILALVLR